MIMTDFIRFPKCLGSQRFSMHRRTEGNPFYVEELARYLVESGAVTLEGQVWDVRETSGLQMPDTVKLVVEDQRAANDSPGRD